MLLQEMTQFTLLLTPLFASFGENNFQKSSVVKEAQEHLKIVQCERSFCDDCRRSIKEFFTSANNDFQPPPLASQTPANSRDIRALRCLVR